LESLQKSALKTYKYIEKEESSSFGIQIRTNFVKNKSFYFSIYSYVFNAVFDSDSTFLRNVEKNAHVIRTDRKILIHFGYFRGQRLTAVIVFVLRIFQRKNRWLTALKFPVNRQINWFVVSSLGGEPWSTVGFYAEKSCKQGK